MIASEVIQATEPAPAVEARTDQLGQQEFLTMLIAQLENQDPLNPQEATEFTAQLAQFSSLEQLISMRSAIDSLASAQLSAQTLGAVGLIGREVVAETAQFELGAGGTAPPALSFELAGRADETILEIFDSAGRPVATLDLGARPAGENTVAWDGTGSAGQPLPAGAYSFRLSARAGDAFVDSIPLVRARVTSTALSGAEPMLMLGSVVVPISAVREVREVAP